jgi:hypothetical protein
MSLSTCFRLLGFSALLVTLGFAGSAPAQEQPGKQTAEKDKLRILKKTDRVGNLELSWPDALGKAVFDKPRQELTKNLREAVAALKKGNKPTAEMLKTIRGDYNTMNGKFEENVDDMTATDYIFSRRYLNKLKAAIGVLGDPKAPSYFSEK